MISTPSFVKICDGGCFFPNFVVDLTWNDPPFFLKKSRISRVSATPNEFVDYSDENNESNKLSRYIFLKNPYWQ